MPDAPLPEPAPSDLPVDLRPLPSGVIVRPMQPGDVDAVAEILGYYASREILLWRTADDIHVHLKDFLVADEDGDVVGCVALRDYGDGLEELRSLAVREDRQGRRIGVLLVHGSLKLAVKRGAELLFALTRQEQFFKHLGFVSVKKAVFPEKVWKDCTLCRLKDDCNEVAVCLELHPDEDESSQDAS